MPSLSRQIAAGNIEGFGTFITEKLPPLLEDSMQEIPWAAAERLYKATKLHVQELVRQYKEIASRPNTCHELESSDRSLSRSVTPFRSCSTSGSEYSTSSTIAATSSLTMSTVTCPSPQSYTGYIAVDAVRDQLPRHSAATAPSLNVEKPFSQQFMDTVAIGDFKLYHMAGTGTSEAMQYGVGAFKDLDDIWSRTPYPEHFKADDIMLSSDMWPGPVSQISGACPRTWPACYSMARL